MQNRENITTLSNQNQSIEERNKILRVINTDTGEKRTQSFIQTRYLPNDPLKQDYIDKQPVEMIQREAQKEQKFTSQFNGFQDKHFQQSLMNVQIQKQNKDIMNNLDSQPCKEMQKDLQISQQGKRLLNQVNQSNTTLNSVSINNLQINQGINSQFTISDQFQTLSNTDRSSQNGYFGSVQVIGNGNNIIDEQTSVGNRNNKNMFLQNENIQGGNLKSLEVSNYSYRGGQQVECPRIDQFNNQQSYVPNLCNLQNDQSQQQKWDVKVQEEHKFHSKNYDSILENLGRKIENIAKIAKESEKHDIEIKKYISNENSFDCMFTSPNNKQGMNYSDSKNFQDIHFLQDTDNKSNELNNQLTNRSNNNLTSRTNGQSISTIYNLNLNNLNHNNSQSLPLTETDRTFGIQQQMDLHSHRSLAKNNGENKINNLQNIQNEDGQGRVDSSRTHYKEYPSGMMVIQNNLQKMNQNKHQNQKKETDNEQVSKKLEDLLQNGGEDSDYVFYNMSVFQQCPHIYSQTKYIIFTQSEFEKLMQKSTQDNHNIINQQQRIKHLEEKIVNLNMKQETLMEYQNEIISKNQQLSEQNATLLKTLGNISTEKSTQQLKEAYKFQQSQQNQVNQLKKSDLSTYSTTNEIKQTSQSYHISNSNQEDKKHVKLSVIGDNKENQLKINNINNNGYDQNMNQSSQQTMQLQTPNTKKQEQKVVNNSGSHFGSKAVTTTTQTKRQNDRSGTALGESQYFSKESNNTFNTDHYTSCDIEENKPTEPAYGDSMRQKTEEEEVNNYHARSSGSLMSIPSQKSIIQNQSLNHQASTSSLNNVLSYQYDNSNTSSTTLQGFINQSNLDSSRQMMMASQSGNSIFVKNKPPIQPKHKGTILIKDFLQQDSQIQANSNQKTNENISINKDLIRVNSSDIVLESTYNQVLESARSQISTFNQANDSSRNNTIASIDKQNVDSKKISATKLLKSKIIMSQQNSQDQIQKQLQEKQHHLVEQLQNLTKNDDCQTVNTKLSSTNIYQLNNQISQQQNTTISSLTNGLTGNNNHILKISPSFLKNKVSQPNGPNNPQQPTLSTHSKSIDSYSMQQQQKKNLQENPQISITSSSPFTQGVRASALAGKVQASLQQNPINYLNGSEQQSNSELSKNTKQTKKNPSQVNQINNKVNKTDNIKKSNLSNMNYHVSGQIGINQNNKNSNIQNNSSITNGSFSQQNSSIEEFSSTSSRGKKGLQQPSTFYIMGGTNSNELQQQQQIPLNRVPTKGQSQMMTSFSQQMHSSQSSSFMNNDSIIPTANKTTMNNKFESVNSTTSQFASVTHESNKSNGNQQPPLINQQQSQFNQSQKIGQTALILKQITKSQPRQHSAKPHSNNSTNNTTNTSNNNNPLNSTQQKVNSYSLDKTQSNSIGNMQKQPFNQTQYSFNLQLNETKNKQENQYNNININNLKVTTNKQSSPIKNNLDKRKSGSLTQRDSDYNEKPFNLKHHVLQNQKNNDKVQKQQQETLKATNENFNDSQRCLEKRTKHTNSVPHFSSQSIAGKSQTFRGTDLDIKGAENRMLDPTVRQGSNITGVKKLSVRPNSLNNGGQRHFTSLNDQSNSGDKTMKESQYIDDQKQQIMTERIDRDALNQKDKSLKTQNFSRNRNLLKQEQVGDGQQDMRNDQECNIF